MEKQGRLQDVDIDYLIKYVLSHLFDEILGKIEEEKEVNQIGKKGVEMRKNKAQECLYILGKVIRVESIDLIVQEIRKEIENKKLDPKVLSKYEESLRSLVNGLNKNKNLNV